MDPLGFAIVGCGAVADTHAQAITHLTGGRLVAVMSRDLTKAKTFAAKHGAPFATDDLTALLARPDVHVVCITTPSGAHLAPAIAAARAGKHLVVEKPLEITLDRADALLAAAAENGVTVAPIFQARFSPGAQALKHAVVSGRFGRLALASVYVKWQRPPAYYAGTWRGTLDLDGGAVLINQGIHGIDLLQWLAGRPTEVFAWTTRRVHLGIEGEDTAVATLRFPSGALGTIEATTAAHPGWSRRLELCGEHGSATLEDDRILRWDFRTPEAGDAAHLDALAGTNATRPNVQNSPAIGYAGHQHQLQNLLDHLRHGTPLQVTAPDARDALALVRALYASAYEGRPISLTPPTPHVTH